MLVAVFGDAHGHAEALDAVLAAAESSGAEQRWSLGDMVGGGTGSGARGRADARVVRGRAARQPRLRGDGEHRAGAVRGAGVARRAVDRARSGAARRGRARVDALAQAGRAARRRRGAGTGARATPVHEFVGASNAAACLAVQGSAARARRPHPRPGGVPGAPAARRRAAGRGPAGRAARRRRGQVAAQPGRGRRAAPVAAGVVGRARRPGRRVLAPARPGAAGRDVAAARRSIPRPRERARRALGLD